MKHSVLLPGAFMSNAVQLSFLSALSGNISQKGANALQVAGAGSFDGVLNQRLQSLQPANNIQPPTTTTAGLANPFGSLLPPGNGSNLPVNTASLSVEDIDLEQTLSALEFGLGATFAPLDSSSAASRLPVINSSSQQTVSGGSAQVVKAQPSIFIGLAGEVSNIDVSAAAQQKLLASTNEQAVAGTTEGRGYSSSSGIANTIMTQGEKASVTSKALLSALGETETGSLRETEKWSTLTSSARVQPDGSRNNALDTALGASLVNGRQSVVPGELSARNNVQASAQSMAQESINTPLEQQVLARGVKAAVSAEAVTFSNAIASSFELNAGAGAADARMGRQSLGSELESVVPRHIDSEVKSALSVGAKAASAQSSAASFLVSQTPAVDSFVNEAKLLSNDAMIKDAAKELSKAVSSPSADSRSQSSSPLGTANIAQATQTQFTNETLNSSNQFSAAANLLGQFAPNARTTSFNADGMLSKTADAKFAESTAHITDAGLAADLPDRPVTAALATSGQNSGFASAVSSTVSGSLALNMGDASNPANNSVPQLAQRIQWMMSNAAHQVAEIRVDPPELGSLQIQVSSDEKQTSMSFLTQTSAARELIEASLPRLREHLESMGIELGDASVEQQDSDQQSMPESEQQTADRLPATGTETANESSSLGKSSERDGGIDAYA